MEYPKGHLSKHPTISLSDAAWQRILEQISNPQQDVILGFSADETLIVFSEAQPATSRRAISTAPEVGGLTLSHQQLLALTDAKTQREQYPSSSELVFQNVLFYNVDLSDDAFGAHGMTPLDASHVRHNLFKRVIMENVAFNGCDLRKVSMATSILGDHLLEPSRVVQFVRCAMQDMEFDQATLNQVRLFNPLILASGTALEINHASGTQLEIENAQNILMRNLTITSLSLKNAHQVTFEDCAFGKPFNFVTEHAPAVDAAQEQDDPEALIQQERVQNLLSEEAQRVQAQQEQMDEEQARRIETEKAQILKTQMLKELRDNLTLQQERAKRRQDTDGPTPNPDL